MLGLHQMIIESYDLNNINAADSAGAALKTDTLDVYVVEYIRTTPITAWFSVILGESDSFDVEYCYPSVDFTALYPLMVNLR